MGKELSNVLRFDIIKWRSSYGPKAIWPAILFAFSFVFVIGAPLIFSPAHAAGTEADIVQAVDRAFLDALAKADSKTVRRMLASDFSWTTSDGEINNRSRALHALNSTAILDKDETEVQNHFYGRVATVRGVHSGMRFLRIWARREDSWKLFAMIDTRVAPKAGPASVEAQAGQGDCDNPCRTVPYRPKTAMDKAILATWQKTKMIEWKPDAKAWASFIGEEFMIINNTTIRNRAEREVIARKQEAAGVGTPGDPILAMRIIDFGDNAAVMFSKHFPVRGGKPYQNIRVWVLRDGRWQLAISQQSEVKSAAPIAAVALKQ